MFIKMRYLSIILINTLIFSLILNYLYITSKKSPIQIVNNMGLGYNLANSFESYSLSEEIKTPIEKIILWGNPPPTKETIISIKKSGFKTIRLPITWMNFMDDTGKVNSDWMSYVKNVVDWIINANMYCIINLHHDGAPGNWLSEGLISKNKYIFLWTQIANEFKDYDDEHLIFESMNEVQYYTDNNIYDYNTLVNLTQAFVDTIRNSGGNNKNRLLLISGANTDIDLTCSPDYKMPIDPYNRLAISVHYYFPHKFTLEPDYHPWTYINNGIEYEIPSIKEWGDEGNYNDMIEYFEMLKKNFVNKGIPVIIGETSVLTEELKDVNSIREYLYAEFTFSSEYNGIMSCLLDTSNKKKGNRNYYNRETGEWYDKIIRDNFKKISKGNYIKPSDFFTYSKIKTITNTDTNGNLYINIGKKLVIKIFFNAKINKSKFSSVILAITSNNKEGDWIGYPIILENGKKEYDGSYTFTYDVSKKELNDHIQIEIWDGMEYISLNYLSVEFSENHISIDYNAYKLELLNK